MPIDDEVYIEDWWDKLALLKTYFHNLNRPDFGLARWGISLIPPESHLIKLDVLCEKAWLFAMDYGG